MKSRFWKNRAVFHVAEKTVLKTGILTLKIKGDRKTHNYPFDNYSDDSYKILTSFSVVFERKIKEIVLLGVTAVKKSAINSILKFCFCKEL